MREPGSDSTYLIIGGTGFLGKNLVKLLTARHKRTVVVGTGKNYHPVSSEMYIPAGELTIDSIPKKYRERLIMIDFAYASVPNTSFEDPINDFSKNLLNIIRYLDFAKAVRAIRYVYISSGGTVYGDTVAEQINEETANYPISPYGITKMACERYVHMYHFIDKLDTCIVRPSNVFGPFQKPFRGQGFIATVLALLFQDKPANIFGNGDIIRDYLYVDDFCNALMDVIEYGKNGEVYNVGYGLGYSINDVLKQINLIALNEGKVLQLNHLPPRPFDVKKNILDISKIQALNGWKPLMPLQKGLDRTWEWMKSYLTAVSR
jgi:UDP-glucose 4-epimerase